MGIVRVEVDGKHITGAKSDVTVNAAVRVIVSLALELSRVTEENAKRAQNIAGLIETIDHAVCLEGRTMKSLGGSIEAVNFLSHKLRRLQKRRSARKK
jgi:hypothetical protein